MIEAMAPRVPSTALKHPRIGACASVLPNHRDTRSELVQLARGYWPNFPVETKVLERFFRRVAVEQRHLALPVERYAGLSGLKERSEAWLAAALDLGEAAVRVVLDEAGINPRDVSMIMSTTVTGLPGA
jgi:alkylresorcinol/alkylpyrone synthase